jgi:hypothetical protein
MYRHSVELYSEHAMTVVEDAELVQLGALV